MLDVRSGKDGAPGPRGEPGPRGPRPEHEWDETRLRFQRADGTWGKWTELKGDKGEKGERGRDGVGGGTITVQGGAGSSGYSYFPGGWT
jgi:hypothetical protein